MQIVGIRQNSPRWIRSRVGLVTASHVWEVCTKRKTNPEKELTSRRHYRNRVVLERVNGRAWQTYVTEEMQWGIDHQSDACERYEIETGVFLQEGGWWLHDKIRMFGASPDYLLDDGLGIVEVKCPTIENHYEFYKSREIPIEYQWQIRAQLSVTGRAYCDYVSFDPRCRERHMQIVIQRVMRDEALIRGMEAEVQQFLREVDDECRASRERKSDKVVVMARA